MRVCGVAVIMLETESGQTVSQTMDRASQQSLLFNFRHDSPLETWERRFFFVHCHAQ